VPAGPLPDSDMNSDITKVFKSRAFLDSFSEGLIIQDLEGHIVDANSASSTLLGISRDKLLGRTSFDPPWRADIA